MGAAQKGHKKVVEQLLSQSSIEVNKAAGDGATPLLVAAQKGHKKVVEQLLSKSSIEVNKAKKNAATLLLVSCLNGYDRIVEQLLRHHSITSPFITIIVEQLLNQFPSEANKARGDG